jgi:hypothetical protein
MTPAASQTPNLRKQIGPAVWLFALLGQFVPADWRGDKAVYVAGGNAVTDAELALRLEASERVVGCWRRRLRAARLIGWLTVPDGKGRVFWLEVINPTAGSAQEIPSVKTAALEALEPASGWLQ